MPKEFWSNTPVGHKNEINFSQTFPRCGFLEGASRFTLPLPRLTPIFGSSNGLPLPPSGAAWPASVVGRNLGRLRSSAKPPRGRFLPFPSQNRDLNRHLSRVRSRHQARLISGCSRLFFNRLWGDLFRLEFLFFAQQPARGLDPAGFAPVARGCRAKFEPLAPFGKDSVTVGLNFLNPIACPPRASQLRHSGETMRIALVRLFCPGMRRSLTRIRPKDRATLSAFCTDVRQHPARAAMASIASTQTPLPWHSRAMTVRTAISAGVKLAAIFEGTAPDAA